MSIATSFLLLCERLKRELPLGSKEREDVFVEVLEMVDILGNRKMLGRLQALVGRIQPADEESTHLLHLVAEARKDAKESAGDDKPKL